MDDLLTEFLVEAGDHLDAASTSLLRLEKAQADSAQIASLFRNIHTIKGSSGFLGLSRVARLAHATETLLARFRDGAVVTPADIALILRVVDRLSALLGEIARIAAEPEGDDADLLGELASCATNIDATCEPGAAPRAHVVPATRSLAPANCEPPGEAAPAKMPTNETVRISIAVLDRLRGIVSELVSTRNQLVELSNAVDNESMKASMRNLTSVTSDLKTR